MGAERVRKGRSVLLGTPCGSPLGGRLASACTPDGAGWKPMVRTGPAGWRGRRGRPGRARIRPGSTRPWKTSAGAPARMPPSSSARSSRFMAGSITASDVAISVGRDGTDDRLVDAEHGLEADRLEQGGHELALLEVLVGEVAAREGGEVQVELVGQPALVRAVGVSRRGGQVDEGDGAPVEGRVVGGDPLGHGGQVRLEVGQDRRVLVLGVHVEEGDDAAHVVGAPRRGRSGRWGRRSRPTR